MSVTAPASVVQPVPARRMLGLALPAMAALAADPLLSLVDTALVGRLGPAPLAALGIDTAIFSTLFWLFNFLTYGTTAEVARLTGARQDAAAAGRVWLAARVALACGVAVTVVLLAAGPAIVAVMGAQGDVVTAALAYLRVRALAAVPVLFIAVAHGAFRGVQDTKTPFAVAVVANAGNALASWFFIYPVGLGVSGAAAGTLLAQSLAAAVFLVLLRRRFADAAPPEPGATRRLLVVSRHLFLRTASLLAALLIATAAAARLGTVTVAAHQVARELWVLLALLLDGFAIAGQALVATSLGAGRVEQARADATRLVAWGFVVGCVIGAGYLALASVLPRVFTDDPAVLAAIASVWPIVALLQPVGGVVFVLDGILMGAGDFRFLFVATAAAAFVGLVPVAVAAVAFDWDLRALWWGMAALMALRLAGTAGRFASGRWAR